MSWPQVRLLWHSAAKAQEVEQSDEFCCKVCQADKGESQACNGFKGIDKNKINRLKKWITN